MFQEKDYALLSAVLNTVPFSSSFARQPVTSLRT